MDELDTLKKFGSEFQDKAILCLLKDQKFLEQIFDILSEDYFETDSRHWMVKKIKEYFVKYKTIPTGSVFKIEVGKLENEVLKTSITEQLKIIASKIKDTDLPYVKEQFLAFCTNQKMKNAILASVDLLKLGEYDKIKSLVDEARKAGMERNLGHEYLVDMDKRMSEMCRDTVKTNWEVIDKLLDGGLAKGELAFIIGNAGVGKSWILNKIGSESMKQGKNVLHVTLELNENYVGLRYDSCFTGIDFQDIRKNIDRVKKEIGKIKGKLFIKYFPIKTISPQMIKMHIERLQMITGIKIDMLVVDYADLLCPLNADKNSNSYTEAGSVYEELRSIAGELQIPCWSASQAHRSSAQSDIVQGHNVADSYRKIMTGDFVMSVSRKTEDMGASTARFHIIKNRFGPDMITLPTYFNASNGDIKIYEENSPQGIELKRKMQDGEDHIKDKIREHWGQIKKENGFVSSSDEE